MTNLMTGPKLAGRCLVLALLLSACGDNPSGKIPVGSAPTGGQTGIRIHPEQPTSGDCLNVIIAGGHGSVTYQWFVNDQPSPATNEASLCNDFFKRGDRVTVKVGDGAQANSATVTIANSPPKVTGISTSPEEWRSGAAIEVIPAAQDADGDPVEFRYQWSINGEVDSFLSEATLPAERNRRGDRVEVLITPLDGKTEGVVFRGVVGAVTGSAPTIVSRPPTRFEAMEYSYQVKAEDPDKEQLTFSLDNPPQGMTIDPASGKIFWPLTGVQPGKYEVKIVVRDPEGGEDRQEYELTLGVPASGEAAKP